MHRFANTLIAATFLVTALSGRLPAVAQADSTCLAPHEIQAGVGSGRFLAIANALRRHNINPQSIDLGQTRICFRDGVLSYVVVILQGGTRREITLPAAP